MIYITEDSFDNLSQMDQQFLNPTALNFREVGPQIDANYDDAFRTGEVEKIAYKLGGEDNSEPIREVPVGRYAMEAIYSATGKPLSFSDKIKNAVIKAEVEKYNSNRDPEEFAFSQQAHNLYNSARDNYYQNDSNFNDTASSNLAMSESAAVDRDTLNLMYNYGKTELQKDITAFGKHYILNEEDDGFDNSFGFDHRDKIGQLSDTVSHGAKSTEDSETDSDSNRKKWMEGRRPIDFSKYPRGDNGNHPPTVPSSSGASDQTMRRGIRLGLIGLAIAGAAARSMSAQDSQKTRSKKKE